MIEFDRGRHFRGKIGYVLLSSEQTVEDDVVRLRPNGVGVHFARLKSPDKINCESLAKLGDQLADCAATIVPNGQLDVVCYACTSGSLLVGEDKVRAELSKGAPQAQTTSLITSVRRALNKVGARRIVVGTPYVDEINKRECVYLEKVGFEIIEIVGLGIENDSDMVKVAPTYLREFACSLQHERADAIFISCSALRTLDVIDEIEEITGKPAICSNQAMIWDTLNLAGVFAG